MANSRPDIRTIFPQQLTATLSEWGHPTYRADQITQWVHRARAASWDEMTNVPGELRERLAETFSLHPLELVAVQGSGDTTRKFLWRLRDGSLIESVLIPANPALYGESSDRHTLCVSTQVGCAYGCRFCASGLEGWKRNLEPEEIVGQVYAVERWHQDQRRKEGGLIEKAKERLVSNLVIMGMGEPLANYEATWRAVETLTHHEGFNLGARRITISTVGLVTGIRRLAEEGTQIGLAISLHAATDELRDELVPINRRYPLTHLMAACRHYVERTRRRISFEYALIHGINDSPEQARQLARLLDGLLCHVNLIPLNPVPESLYQPSPQGRILAFQAELNRWKVSNTLRVERGADIQAGCGQLRCQRMPTG